MQTFVDENIKIEVHPRATSVLIYQYSRTKHGGWRKWGSVIVPLKIWRSLTPLALDGGDSAAFQALSTPEVSSNLQGESNPAHRK